MRGTREDGTESWEEGLRCLGCEVDCIFKFMPELHQYQYETLVRRFAVAVLVAVCFSGCRFHVQAVDWPQWLGAKRDSVWRETGIVEKFPAEGPKTVWRVPIGPGYSGPIVANGFVYVTDRLIGKANTNTSDPFARSDIEAGERVLCLDARTGSTVWKHEYACRYTVSYPAGPRVAPLFDRDQLFTLGAEGNLNCLSSKDGKVVWSREFKKEFGVKAPMWGFAGHPILERDQLICQASGQGSTVVSYDRNTGRELWRALSASEPGYSSPAMFDVQGKRVLIILHADGVNALEPATGKVLWSAPFKSNMGLAVATPRLLGDLLFSTSFYNGSLMLRLSGTGSEPTVLWRTEKGDERKTTHLNSIIATPFLEGGHIYGICSYGQLRCIKAETGERVWETIQPTSSAEPVRWGNAFIVKQENRFFLFNEKGDLIIAKLSPAGYEEVSRAHIIDATNKDPGRSVVWSHPAFANRRVYARNDKEIVCVDLAKGE